MDFHELLEIARRKQERHNNVVKQIEEITERKNKLRIEERMKLNLLPQRKLQHTDLADDSHTRTAVERKILCEDASKCTYNNKNNNTSHSLEKSVPVLTTSSPSTDRELKNNIDSKITCTAKRKLPKPSFSEILEAAKKNVQPLKMKRELFDDLIPCSSALKAIKSGSLEPPLCDKKQYRSDTKSPKSNMPRPKSDNDLEHSANNCNSAKSQVAIQKTKSVPTVITPVDTALILSSDTRPNVKLRSCFESNRSKPASKSDAKAGSSHRSNKTVPSNPKFSGQTLPPRTIKSNSICIRKSITLAPDNVSSKKTYAPTGSSVQRIAAGKPNCSVSIGRGIAAQLGLSSLSKSPIDSPVGSDDDYESDDSFIDDSEAIETKEYARVVRDVHKALRFDPRRYTEVNPWEDLRSMEANYRDIEKEEKRSARIAAAEDAAEIERDLERKRRKLKHKDV